MIAKFFEDLLSLTNLSKVSFFFTLLFRKKEI